MNMAGEVGHVVYAARLLTHLKDSVHDPEYWVRTLFPDIRHLGVISRQHTHTKGVTLSSLVGTNDFATGMRVHSWVDATREQYLSSQNIKETLPWHPFVPHALKLLEDELLYDRFDDWNLIHRLLNSVSDDELHYVHDRQRILTWHSILQSYFAHTPDNASRSELAIGIGLSANSAEEINSVVARLREHKKTIEIIESFWDHLERILI